MQGKSIIRFFLIMLIVVAFYQLFLILPANRVESSALAHAQKVAANAPADQKDVVTKAARISYLDSMSSETAFSIPFVKNYTYQDLKKQQLALGLDLKGGMSVVLQVDLKDFIVNLSENNPDPTFVQALENASKAQQNSQTNFVNLFGQEWEKLANGKKLASIFTLNEGLRDQINLQTTDAAVLDVIRQKANGTVDLTFNRLKERIDKFGVIQPNISLDAARDLIVVELPGVDNPERARKMLETSAELEFWEVYRITDANLFTAFSEADAKLKKIYGDTLSAATPEFTINETKVYTDKDTLGNVKDSTKFEIRRDTIKNNTLVAQGPLSKIFKVGAGSMSVMGVASKNQREQVMKYLSHPEVKALFPADLAFKWGYKPNKDEAGNNTKDYELYAVKVPADGQAPLKGDRVTDASASLDQQTNNRIVVSLRMDGEGTQTWGNMTTKAARDNNREVAIVLDGEVVSAPQVNEPIMTGSSQISGNFTTQEGQDLANILQIGKLPAKTKIIQEATVGPTLGKENISRSLTATILGFLTILVFMVLYYAGGGFISIIALVANLLFIFGTLASLGTVLTLPGIAGIVLTMGMAVDSNVIIYERIREELRSGKTLLTAIKEGYNHSYSAIIDSNITTLIVAFILIYFGLGPIKGFGTVLGVGVVSSVFTSVLVGRLIMDWWTIDKKKDIKFENAWSANILKNVNFDWMGKRKIAYMFSAAYILLGIVCFFTRGFDLGVDFKGGRTYVVQFDPSKTVNSDDVRNSLTKILESEPIVKTFGSANTYSITTDYMSKETGSEADAQVVAKLFEGVNSIAGGNLQLADFKKTDGTGTHISSSTSVGPTIADDIQKSSLVATLMAVFLISLYILVRFPRLSFSIGAAVSLLHDVLFTLSTFTIFWGILPWSMEIDQAFIAAMLTVLGYSINDTVIVFDRIRETISRYVGLTKKETINKAINETLSRTLITSATTLFTVIILFIFGGGSIKSFAWALLVGIGVGTYSSIYIASAIVYDFSKDLSLSRRDAKPSEEEKKKTAKVVK